VRRSSTSATEGGARLARLVALHAEVDAQVARLAGIHRGRLHCRLGCHACCVDGIRVFEIEAERIRAARPELLREAPHPPGACAFLDASGACRIYAERPYVCRTQGLPLRWIDDTPPGGPVERRDICPLNEAGPPLESLPGEVCWSLGPAEGRLAALQAEADGGRLHRVALRDLFGPR
jgi:hypothetical protein